MGDVFKKVLGTLNSTTGESTTDRAEKDKRRAEGEKKAANDRARRNTQTKALNKKAEREYEERWNSRG
jgi:hypothetical protein